LATVFKELNTMVIDQGSILDRIDFNLETTNVNLEAAHEELKKADKYQSGNKAKVLIIILLLLVVFLTVFVANKLVFRRTSKPESVAL
jgi:syntaxin 16